MNKILSIIKKEGLQCLPCERINLDFERFYEYRESDEHPAEALFERPIPSSLKHKVNEVRTSSILHYFLDGSRRTYKIADIIIEGRYLPLIAGQVGVALVQRNDDGRIEPLKEFCHFENVIVFPEMIKCDLPYLEEQINKKSKYQFSLIQYTLKSDRDPVDLGVAQIMKRMQDLEVKVVAELSKKNYLQNDSILVIDGPLRFKEMTGRKLDIVQFRNVIGLSKTFKPSFTIGKGRHKVDVGSITSGLGFGERTSVFRPAIEENIGKMGMWYLRIRAPKMMSNPLEGIIKAECYAIEPEDIESGFDSERINIISGFLLRERNVTPYNLDLRWASHIYPIYLAEKYLKSSFMSDVCFRALF